MKIKYKLAFTYTGITAIVLMVLSLFVYYFFSAYTKDDFFNRLYDRAQVAAQIQLEKDELNSQIYEEIKKMHLQTLPLEQEYVLKLESMRPQDDSLLTALGAPFLNDIMEEGRAYTIHENRSWVGIHYDDNEGDFVILIAAFDWFGNDKLVYLKEILAFGVIITTMLVFIVGYWYASQMLRPIANITHKVNSITTSNLHLRLPNGKGKDELNELSATFNEMLDRLETSFQIQNNFINNASHELKNPLTAILGEAEFALDKQRDNTDYEQSLRIIYKEAIRLEQLTLNLLQLAQTSFDTTGIEVENVRIDEALFDVHHSLYSLNPECRIRVNFAEEITDPAQLQIRGNASMIKIALKNLLENACKFSNNQPVHLNVDILYNELLIEIIDNGEGIPKGEIKSIFEPFYRASNARKYRGFGIGLPLTERIIALHKGKIEVESEPNVQTVFRLRLPLQPAHALV
jgi:signal transduction histidine kinase